MIQKALRIAEKRRKVLEDMRRALLAGDTNTVIEKAKLYFGVNK